MRLRQGVGGGGERETGKRNIQRDKVGERERLEGGTDIEIARGERERGGREEHTQ